MLATTVISTTTVDSTTTVAAITNGATTTTTSVANTIALGGNDNGINIRRSHPPQQLWQLPQQTLRDMETTTTTGWQQLHDDSNLNSSMATAWNLPQQCGNGMGNTTTVWQQLHEAQLQRQ